MRTSQYLYIRNFESGRWPAGDPQVLKADGSIGPMQDAYFDIDLGPTRDLLIRNHDDPSLGRFFQLAVANRPVEELFDIAKDPDCLKNLAANPFAEVKEALSRQLMDHLLKTGDPRASGNGGIWESYPRYGGIRMFPPP